MYLCINDPSYRFIMVQYRPDGFYRFSAIMVLFLTSITGIILIDYKASGQNTVTIKPFTDPVCLGNSLTLKATVSTTEYGTDSYTFQVIPYAPLDTTIGTPVDLTLTHCNATSGGKDDCWGGPYNIGFNFCFFNLSCLVTLFISLPMLLKDVFD